MTQVDSDVASKNFKPVSAVLLDFFFKTDSKQFKVIGIYCLDRNRNSSKCTMCRDKNSTLVRKLLLLERATDTSKSVSVQCKLL